ncbi:MAG: diacylglycerol kinase [Candidatus Omnitrophica bacterium]|nr:diacylglycerol kinase [Candidatus Omnitrophota bacterium]
MARKKQQRLVESLNSAVEGFLHVLRTQRNMRLHFLLATLVIVLSIYLSLPKVDLLLLLISIMLVLALEMVNTAIELTIDLIKDAYHPLARVIKDVTAGAVFLAALNAAAVGYIVFSKRFSIAIEKGISEAIHTPWHVTFIAFLVLLFLVLVGKILFHKGTPFRGGMPSGHSAFAFSMWTVIAFSTRNVLIIILTFVMAFLIARHRLTNSVHNRIEVASGAVLGILVTSLIFQLLL